MIDIGFLESRSLNSITPLAYTVEHGESGNGPFEQVKPVNPNAAQMTLWAGRSYCDILFGRAFQIELEPTDDKLLSELIDAVLLGGISEVIWSRKENSSHSYSKSFIQLATRKASCSWGIPFIYSPWWKRKYAYQAYETTASSAQTK